MDKNSKVGEPTCDESPAAGAPINVPSSRLEVHVAQGQLCHAENAELAQDRSGDDNEVDINRPRLTHRDGVALVEGCGVPVWRLEMVRRAGSGPAALMAGFSGLTLSGIELAIDYTQRNAPLVETLVERQRWNNALAGSDEEPDNVSGSDAELDTLLDENSEVFRRLAQ